MTVQRPEDVTAAIAQAEEAGDFEQSGYLRAPGLQAHTGDSFEGMLTVCAVLKLRDDLPTKIHQQTAGVERWINEQLEQSK